MKLYEIVAWYQKKIGTYDKQQWEKTVEQNILDGFCNTATLKTAKLKTELIDVDLVRGSTFHKAKPKQSLLTVIRLAILRYLFLPVYAQWWAKQTSPNIFGILLFLYLAQMVNWAVYTFNIHHYEQTASSVVVNVPCNITLEVAQHYNQADQKITPADDHIVSITELLIPMTLSLILSLMHSQIVATNSVTGVKQKQRRFSNANKNNKQHRDARVRRRRKILKNRCQDFVDVSTQSRKTTAFANPVKLHDSSQENITKPRNVAVPLRTNFEAFIPNSMRNPPYIKCHDETVLHTSAIENMPYYQQLQELHQSKPLHKQQQPQLNLNLKLGAQTTLLTSSKQYQIDLKDAVTRSTHVDSNDLFIDCLSDMNEFSMQKKRNVNWKSPVHKFAIETQEQQQQTSPSTSATASETGSVESSAASSLRSGLNNYSSTSSNNSPTKSVRIDECVLEFYDDLVKRTTMLPPLPPLGSNSKSSHRLNSLKSNPIESNIDMYAPRRPIGEDDGFESLNGKSSSGEESLMAIRPPNVSGTPIKSQLRLRLNVGEQINNNVEELRQSNVDKTSNLYQRRRVHQSVESIYDIQRATTVCDVYQQTQALKKKPSIKNSDSSSTDATDEDGDDGEIVSSPTLLGSKSNSNDCTTSATEWLGVTTNSECSYSSELENSDDYKNNQMSDADLDYTPTTILNPHGTNDRISCTIWAQHEIKKAQMSVLEISSCIIERVERMPETNDYIYYGIFFSLMLTLIPCFCRLCEAYIVEEKQTEVNYMDLFKLLWAQATFPFVTIFQHAFGYTHWEQTVLVISFIQRLVLTAILFIIFAVAERTFKQRFLYAKIFSHITSSRRARKSNVPHFRLNKVRNIKTWLSVRSYLKKRGPQRSVDVIVSTAFIVNFLLLSFLSVEWLKDSVHLHCQLCLEALAWSATIGIFLLRFMTLGNKIHEKYRSISVLITEQINLYLQIEQKPKKKDELMVSNSVLKLAADLLKELEKPFKISGLSANPYLFTTIKVVILSALSGVLSEMLGFKLKLHKIKIK